MCGFAGVLEQPGAPGVDTAMLARAMAERLAHRGPDSAGVWSDPAAGVALGHRRLAVIDLSPEGHQPMVSASGDSVIAYNGEIYNHRELRARFEECGRTPRWRGHSDTETLIEWLEAHGVEPGLRDTNGMFAFALWQRRARRLVLARDRLGEKPLYYGYCGQSFVFGSELKALRRHPAWQGAIDLEALSLYLRFGFVPAPYSIYCGIRKLEAGTLLTIDGEDIARRRLPEPVPYWDAGAVALAAERQPFTGSADAAAEALSALLKDAVRIRLEADVPLGAFLSGGIDSSSVVALMQSCAAKPVRSFTIGFHDPRLDEAPSARAIAAHLNTEHTELYVGEDDALALVPKLPEIYDEPFADISQLPTALICQLARGHVTVALTGDGGDELFGGYPRYEACERRWRRLAALPAPLRTGLGALAQALPARAIDHALHGLLLAHGRKPRLASRLKRRLEEWGAAKPEALIEAQLAQWREFAPPALVPGAARSSALCEGMPALAEPLRRMMFCDARRYLPDDILVKVDRASMAVALETRLPFLDHRLVGFAWSLPPEARRAKALLARVLERDVPRILFERPKRGFEPPVASWLRGALKEWADDLLSAASLASDGLIAAGPVAARWREHRAGLRNWHLPLWSVLMFEAWRRAGG